MLKFEPVTYYFNRPIGGTIREDDRTASWTIKEVTFSFLEDGQSPPSYGMILNCHRALRDDEGNEIHTEILSLLDLEAGLREAMNREFGAAWAAVKIAP